MSDTQSKQRSGGADPRRLRRADLRPAEGHIEIGAHLIAERFIASRHGESVPQRYREYVVEQITDAQTEAVYGLSIETPDEWMENERSDHAERSVA